ncbi:MAG TPA: cytochrome c oxidase subunit 3 [Terriglobia bacterium]|jgi:cytochrome c oxidase subunit 3
MAMRAEHQFDDIEQQRDAAYTGMWVFLSTEVLFFGAVFFAYILYRGLYYQAFVQGSRELSIWMGGLNTAILLCSSLFMALAVHAAQRGRTNQLVMYLIITEIVGAVFLGIKFLEYYQHYKDHLIPGMGFGYGGANANRVELFMVFYFILTGMHAVHMIIGLGVLSALAILATRGKFEGGYYDPVDIGGLYWHFVDIVWVFIFPLLYLVKRTGV